MARASRASGPLTSKHSLVRRVERALAAESLLPPGSRVIAAVSGGADSVFLLRALHALLPVRHLEVEVAQFNHRWRGDESDADAAFVAALATELGLQFHEGTTAGRRSRSTSPEEAAREERYGFLDRVAAVRAADVAVGHTLDDQLETYLLGWLRGSGPAGASLMPWSGPLPAARSAARLLRPLLSIGRVEIRAALRAAGVTWREDPTNLDPRFLRSRVRAQLVPLLESLSPGAHRAILRSAGLSYEAAGFLRRSADAAAAQLFATEGSALTAERAAFLEIDRALRAPVLSRAVRRLVGAARGVESAHLERALSVIQRGVGGQRTPRGPAAELRLARGRIVIGRRPSPAAEAE